MKKIPSTLASKIPKSDATLSYHVSKESNAQNIAASKAKLKLKKLQMPSLENFVGQKKTTATKEPRQVSKVSKPKKVSESSAKVSQVPDASKVSKAPQAPKEIIAEPSPEKVVDEKEKAGIQEMCDFVPKKISSPSSSSSSPSVQANVQANTPQARLGLILFI